MYGPTITRTGFWAPLVKVEVTQGILFVILHSGFYSIVSDSLSFHAGLLQGFCITWAFHNQWVNRLSRVRLMT